jgi:hypothetical protein
VCSPSNLRAVALVVGTVLAAPTALASTFVVDAAGGAGAHFTDIPPAIAAAAPGDVLLVRAGSYSPFVLDKGLAILADAGADVAGTITVQNVATIRAALAGLACDALRVADCSRVVLVAGTTVRGSPAATPTAAVAISNALDVRLQGLTVPGGFGNASVGQDAMSVSSSRVEVVGSSLRGRNGRDGTNNPVRPHGGQGLRIGLGANVHVAHSQVRGGDGGDNLTTAIGNYFGGDGGDAFRLTADGARLLLTGLPSDVAGGGYNGWGDNCFWDGAPGAAIRVEHPSAVARVSGTTLAGGGYLCDDSLGPAIVGPVDQPASADPVLEALPAVLAPGQTCTFVVHAPPGTDVRLRLGRRPIVEDLPASAEDRLVEPLRSWGLGIVPPSGSVAFPFTMPSTSPPGALLVLQAVGIDAGGGTELTASWPALLR